jgi:hypothetical protein
MHRVFAALILSALLPAAWGMELRSVEVGEHDGRYTVSFEARIDVPVDRALHLMLTPDLWPQLSPIITKVKVLIRDAAGPRRVQVTYHDCVLIFCKTLRKTEDVAIGRDGRIESLAIPAESDFSYAREDWQIVAEDGGTRIRYRSEMVPNFFVPPLIGPYILKSRMRAQLTQTAANLEKLSRHAAPQAQQ